MKVATKSKCVYAVMLICPALFIMTLVYSNVPTKKSRWSGYTSAGQVLKTHNVTGATNKWREKFGYLKPKDHYVVPNIAHFIWFSCHPFKFEHLISMLSAHRVMKAEKIYFYTDCEPSGEWWAEAKELIPTLHVESRSRPTKVFNKILNPKWPQHSADVARLQILMERGGVYLDTDVFVVAPLEPLRYYDYVVGRPESKVLNNGVIIASKHSQFLKIYYKSYEKYNSKCWACSSVRNQHTIAMKHKHLLHIEPHSMVNPPYTEWKKLFLNNYNWKVGHFTIHVWFRTFRNNVPEASDFNPDNIRNLDTAFGEMCRYMYYGSPDIFE
ncbi:uncharacterized protein [Ptychodera flava]|uniref:uncharacterized protein isoform X2 n=1 Tax=Ptychodera flava TaxID=63121 RepID=UPI003969EEE8